MKNPHMLYRCPGPLVLEGVACETLTVEAEDMEAAMAEGWHRDWMQAKAAHDALSEKIAQAEQEQADLAAKIKKAKA